VEGAGVNSSNRPRMPLDGDSGTQCYKAVSLVRPNSVNGTSVDLDGTRVRPGWLRSSLHWHEQIAGQSYTIGNTLFGPLLPCVHASKPPKGK
jgi:hypothetical protein